MQNKLEFFSRLPDSIQGEVTRFLPNEDFIKLSMTSKSNSPVFNANQDVKRLYKAREFLHHVVRGNHEAVAKMLKEDPALMRTRGQVKDLSGRRFTNISGFEYCMWALDKHMWTTMLDCLPATGEGEGIRSELRAQYLKIKKHGVTYTLDAVTPYYMPEMITRTEKHFDFEGTIIKELQEFVNKGDANQWVTGVGGAQRLFPVHVVDEYCCETYVSPVSDFKEPHTSSKKYKVSGQTYESWFSSDSKLGKDFAIYKVIYSISADREHLGGPRAWSKYSIKSMNGLYNVRTNDFQALETALEPRNLCEYESAQTVSAS